MSSLGPNRPVAPQSSKIHFRACSRLFGSSGKTINIRLVKNYFSKRISSIWKMTSFVPLLAVQVLKNEKVTHPIGPRLNGDRLRQSWWDRRWDRLESWMKIRKTFFGAVLGRVGRRDRSCSFLTPVPRRVPFRRSFERPSSCPIGIGVDRQRIDPFLLCRLRCHRSALRLLEALPYRK